MNDIIVETTIAGVEYDSEINTLTIDINVRDILEAKNACEKAGENPGCILVRLQRGVTLFGIPIEIEMTD